MRQLLRRFFLLSLIGLLVLETSGCGPQWKRKFVRKKKQVTVEQPVLVLQSEMEATQPPEVRYQAHFVYWKSWHTELIDYLGEVRKRDLRYLNGTIGELRAMAELISGPPADRLRKILTELSEMEEAWNKAPASSKPSATDRTRLEKLRREIDKNLHYSKVKQWIPSGTGSSSKP